MEADPGGDVMRKALEFVIVDEQLRAAVRDHVGEIVRREPRIQCDQHRAGKGHAVMRLEQRAGIGGEHGNAPAVTNTHVVQSAAQSQAPVEKFRVGKTAFGVNNSTAVGVDLSRAQQERCRGQRLEGRS